MRAKPAGRMLRMDQVHVVRHKVLVGVGRYEPWRGRWALLAIRWKHYLEHPVPVRVEKEPRVRPVCGKVAARLQELLPESPQWTGSKQRLTAACRRRLHGGFHDRESSSR